MPRKVRELKRDLRKAGYRQVPRRGKGSHTYWAHPSLPDTVTLAGNDGADAQPYQEDDVRVALEMAAKLPPR